MLKSYDVYQLYVKWFTFTIFVLISLVKSIKQSWFKTLPLSLRIKYWMKKCVWSFLICISLMIAAESEPLSYYLDGELLSMLTVICLSCSLFAHIYGPSVCAAICIDINEDENEDENTFDFELEMHKYQDVKLEINTKNVANISLQPKTQTQQPQPQPPPPPALQPKTQPPQPQPPNYINKSRIRAVMVTETEQEIGSAKQLNVKLERKDIKQCEKCKIVRKGEIDPNDGLFYCLECWNEYNA
eukprot:423501_1